jgi:hypothetical protein
MNVDVGVRRRFSCSPEQVFAVLHDGWIYPVWIVGASRMRDVDDGWPAYVFFASQESSYITAEMLAVTGGQPVT